MVPQDPCQLGCPPSSTAALVTGPAHLMQCAAAAVAARWFGAAVSLQQLLGQPAAVASAGLSGTDHGSTAAAAGSPAASVTVAAVVTCLMHTSSHMYTHLSAPSRQPLQLALAVDAEGLLLPVLVLVWAAAVCWVVGLQVCCQMGWMRRVG